MRARTLKRSHSRVPMLAAACAYVLCCSCPDQTERAAVKPAQYPVRWTKHVNLKSLSDISKLLDKPVEQNAELKLTAPDDKTTRVVKTPREYLNLQDKGYYAYSTLDMKVESFFMEVSMPITHLKHATSSRVSHLADFRLTGDSLDCLPPTLALGGPWEGDFCREVEAAEKAGKTWKQVFPATKVKIRDAHSIELTDEGSGMIVILTLEAWGDFNHDGVEDILLRVTDRCIGGTYFNCDYVVLTRLTAGARLNEVPFRPSWK